MVLNLPNAVTFYYSSSYGDDLPTVRLASLLLPNYNFATVMNRNLSI